MYVGRKLRTVWLGLDTSAVWRMGGRGTRRYPGSNRRRGKFFFRGARSSARQTMSYLAKHIAALDERLADYREQCGALALDHQSWLEETVVTNKKRLAYQTCAPPPAECPRRRNGGAHDPAWQHASLPNISGLICSKTASTKSAPKATNRWPIPCKGTEAGLVLSARRYAPSTPPLKCPISPGCSC